MTITVYTPGITVTLIKMIATGGVAWTAGIRTFDLTQYLGDGGAVSTIKDVVEPAGGFAITFADRVNAQTADTVYALIEPMDLVEIRAARQPAAYVGQPLPVVMRGFVSTIRRAEGVGSDGRPQRAVTIQGQDSGKLWLIHSILSEVFNITDGPYLETFQLQAETGMDAALLPVGDFMTQVVQKIMNPKVAALAAYGAKQVLPFLTDTITVKTGTVSPSTVANFQGPIWNLVAAFANRPWNEVFIRDEEDGPHFVFRPAPYKDITTGDFIIPGATDPGTIALDISDTISLNVSRSDARVANFFWVPPGNSSLDNNSLFSISSMMSGNALDFHHNNNNPALYGIRKMECQTTLIPDDMSALPNSQPAGAQAAAAGDYVQLFQLLNQQLRDMNHDNAVLEEGIAVVKGSETYNAGQYIALTRGGLTSDYYCPRVSHNYGPLSTWTTTIALERGNGFLVRSASSGSPYFSEGFRGPYSTVTP
jgi:hypothetical protein